MATIDPTYDVKTWHDLSVEEVAQALDVDPARGLTEAEAAERRERSASTS